MFVVDGLCLKVCGECKANVVCEDSEVIAIGCSDDLIW